MVRHYALNPSSSGAAGQAVVLAMPGGGRNDGTEVPPAVLQRFSASLWRPFHGATEEGPVLVQTVKWSSVERHGSDGSTHTDFAPVNLIALFGEGATLVPLVAK
jgi:hypothetical protein